MNLINMSIIVQIVGQGPAKDVTFDFSEPVKSPDRQVLSDLPFFEEGLTSLAPGAKITCCSDSLDNLLPAFKEGKVASDITVIVRYKDLNLDPREHQWDITEAMRGHHRRGLRHHVRSGTPCGRSPRRASGTTRAWERNLDSTVL